MGSADPVDGSLDLLGSVGPAAAGLEIGRATQFNDRAGGILDDFIAANDAGVLEAHLTARTQPEILRRRHFHEVVGVDPQLAGEGDLARAQLRIGRVVHRIEPVSFALGDVGEHHLDGAQDGQAAQSHQVQVIANAALEHRHLGEAVVLGHADGSGKGAQRLGPNTPTTQAAQGRHARIVPAGHQAFFDELQQLALAHHRVAEAQAGELNLAGQRAREVERLEHPVVERPVDLELERANGMGDALQIIADRMGVIVHRVQAPTVAGPVVRGVADAVQGRVPQMDVRRRHVDARPQGAGAVRKLALPHALEQIEVLLHGAIAPGAGLAGPLGHTPVLGHLLRVQVADISLAPADEFHREGQHLLEIVGGEERLQGSARSLGGQHRGTAHVAGHLAAQAVVGPTTNEPIHIGLDGLDVFDVFLGRIGVVHPQVAAAVGLAGDAEVQANRLRVADVQVAIGLRRKAGDAERVLPGLQILRDDIADEVCRGGRRRGFRFRHTSSTQSLTVTPGDVENRRRLSTASGLVQREAPGTVSPHGAPHPHFAASRKSTVALSSGVRKRSGSRICTLTCTVPLARLASGAISATCPW